MTLEEVLAAVAHQVSYLRASVVTDGESWVGCDVLVTDPGRLVEVVERAMAGLGTDDRTVAASLFAQAYSFRVSGVALAAYALDLPVPDVALRDVAVRVDKARPSAVAYLSRDVARRDATALADELVGGHLAAFVDAMHRTFRVGARLLWGNVASSSAAAFRAVEGSTGATGAVRDRAESFMATAGEWFDGLGAFSVVRHGEHEGWYWNRTSCCLWYQTKSGQLCDNCSMLDASELHEQRVRELIGAAP